MGFLALAAAAAVDVPQRIVQPDQRRLLSGHAVEQRGYLTAGPDQTMRMQGVQPVQMAVAVGDQRNLQGAVAGVLATDQKILFAVAVEC